VPYCLFETALGTCGIAWSEAGLLALRLPEASREETRDALVARAGEAPLEEVPPPAATARDASTPSWVHALVRDMRAHLGGEPRTFADVPLADARVSPFAARVYAALRAVPAGSTTSYGELAKSAGSAGSARAVGGAMAKNPWPVVVPCHRVTGAAGSGARGGKDRTSLGGFSAYGGVVTKKRLLALEGVETAPRQGSLFEGAQTLPFDAEAAVQHLAAADAVLAKHIARVGGLRLRVKHTEDTFAALAESIVYQQLSGKAAATIFGRLRNVYPRGELHPRQVLGTEVRVLRGAGLSHNKVESLRDLAARALAGEVPALADLARMEDEAIVERLTRVRGVGRWTVEMLLIFRLGRPDVLPASDLGVRKGFARVFRSRRPREGKDGLPSAEEMAARAETWRPYRSVASWYLWRALDA
jgi:methylated-DNA-[protein]-cysteine S-methyltransferase